MGLPLRLNWLTIVRAAAYRASGLILLVSVVLKVTSTEASLPGRTLTGAPLLFVGAEVLLGLWFLSGTAAKVGRTTAILVLTLFVALNLVKVYDGAASCGCFGAVAVAPAYVAAVEVVFLALMLPFPRVSEWAPSDANAAWVVGMAAALFVVYLGVGYGVTGRVASDWLDGGDPAATFEQHVPGDEPGGVTTFELRWRNAGAEPVQLTFLRASCACMQTRSLPLWVAPGEEVVIPVIFTAPGGRGMYRRNFEIVTTATTLRGSVRGQVRAP